MRAPQRVERQARHRRSGAGLTVEPTGMGLVVHLEKEGAVSLSHQVVRWARERGARVVLPPAEAEALGYPELGLPYPAWRDRVRFALVLGGDGTLLSAARSLSPAGVPLVGVNLGRLGFLTTLEPDNLFPQLDRLWRGEGRVEARMMLAAEIVREGRMGSRLLALNDVVIAKGPFARMVHVQAAVDGKVVATYPADGLIVATPTGSTAYSLSAGGPVIAPDVDAVVITPICPHALAARSLVVSPSSEITVQVLGHPVQTLLTADGQQGEELRAGDVVVVHRAPEPARLLRLGGGNFFEVLTSKLAERVPRSEAETQEAGTGSHGSGWRAEDEDA